MIKHTRKVSEQSEGMNDHIREMCDQLTQVGLRLAKVDAQTKDMCGHVARMSARLTKVDGQARADIDHHARGFNLRNLTRSDLYSSTAKLRESHSACERN